MSIIGYVFSGTVLSFLSAVSFLLVLRVLFPLFFSEESPLYVFLYASTEPIILPVRNALEKSEFFSSLPIDFSYIFAMIAIFAVR
ncbi:MAG: YggT family protein, partial [Clostridia bacterium]